MDKAYKNRAYVGSRLIFSYGCITEYRGSNVPLDGSGSFDGVILYQPGTL